MGVVIQGDEAEFETAVLQFRRPETMSSLKEPVDPMLTFADEAEFSLPLRNDAGFDRFSDGRGGMESDAFFMTRNIAQSTKC
jgi:hypothetical protein